MRKKIIEWLFGNDWEEYWDLHKKYCDELHKNLELMEENQEIRKEKLEIMERDLENLRLTRIVLDNTKDLENICEKYGINIQKELELMYGEFE
jgi:hypothetical protein